MSWAPSSYRHLLNECLPSIRYVFKHFSQIVSINPHTSTLRRCCFYLYLRDKEAELIRKVSLLKAVHLVRDVAETRVSASLTCLLTPLDYSVSVTHPILAHLFKRRSCVGAPDEILNFFFDVTEDILKTKTGQGSSPGGKDFFLVLLFFFFFWRR